MSETEVITALFTAMTALVTAASAGMVKIVRELQKISNGKMTRIEDQLGKLTNIEEFNLKMSGKILRELKKLGGKKTEKEIE